MIENRETAANVGEIRQDMPVTSLRICMDSLGDQFAGRIYGVALDQEISFSNINEMLMAIDMAYDRIGKPQPHHILRSFSGNEPAFLSYKGEPKRFHSVEEILALSGKTETIDLVMFTRHYAEWQGMIKHVDGRVIGRFDTMMACLNLIESL